MTARTAIFTGFALGLSMSAPLAIAQSTGSGADPAPPGDDMVGVEALTSARVLVGKRLYDADAEWVGDVTGVLPATGADVQDLVVEIGGFLGIGATAVALDAQRVNIALDPDGDVERVSVDMSWEELKALPRVGM